MHLPSFRRLVGLLLLILFAGCETNSAIDCSLKMIAQMPLQVEDHLLVVPAGINGKWIHLVVDSGAERTTISAATAEMLGLPHDLKHRYMAIGVGGSSESIDAKIERLVLGGVHFPINRLAVGLFDLHNKRGLDADGLLGADILLAFDLDIDVLGGRLTLYRSRICPDARPPWPEASMEIIGVRARRDRLLLPIDLDGTPGLAFLDTGAQGNVLGLSMARRIGLTEQMLATDPPVRQVGIGPGITISHLHQFSLLRIGPVAEETPRITVLPSDFGIGDALIGEQFLQGRRVWMSFRNRQIFVSKRTSEQ